MGKGDYNISEIYQGGYSSLKPTYGDVFTGYRVAAGSLGLTTDPRQANVLQEVSSKLSTGVKQIEIAAVSPEIFDSMPKQQLKEINRLSKLTGIDISIHAPVIDSTGITQQGFSESNRELSERKVADALIRSHELNPDGNVNVTVHSSEGLPGTEWKTLGKEGEARTAKKMVAINKDSGQMTALEEEKRFSPGRGGEEPLIREELHTPEQNLELTNASDWDNKITQLFFNKERADEILQENQVQIQTLFEETGGKLDPNKLNPSQENAWLKFQDAQNYLQEIHKSANALFSKAYEFGTTEQKEKLKEISKKYGNELGETPTVLRESKAMHNLLLNLQNPEITPTMFVPLEEFATEQSAKTFGNAAFNAYKKFNDHAPILCIENPPVGMGLSTGEDLKNLIEASRKQFVENAIKEKGMKEKEANKLAEKFIGATWDVGHINMLRKQGFESKDIVAETGKIAPLVKHVHLSDNFGFEHTELPMGMGNVPLKEILNKLGKEGFDAKKIIEAGNWWQHFKTPPVKETMEALGSPIYSMEMAPYWNQSMGLQQGYSGGLDGAWLPQVNYETFGGGFSQLPTELGGQRPGAQGSRMGGRPME